MTNEPIDDTILEKIRKVQGYLKSYNPNEAAVAAAKLTEMLLKHNIDISQIPQSERKRDPFTKQTIRTETKQQIPEWKISIGFSVAKANLCRMVTSYDSREVYFLGRESNVEVTQFIYETCTRDLQAMADTFWYVIKDVLKGDGTETIHGRTWKMQFLTGAAAGVQQKLREEIERWRNENTNANALIVTNDSELQVYMKSIFPNLGTHSSSSYVRGGNAYGLGVATGKNIQFKTGVGHGGATGPKQIKG